MKLEGTDSPRTAPSMLAAGWTSVFTVGMPRAVVIRWFRSRALVGSALFPFLEATYRTSAERLARAPEVAGLPRVYFLQTTPSPAKRTWHSGESSPLMFQLLMGLGFRMVTRRFAALPRQIRRGLSIDPAPPSLHLETVTRLYPINCTGRDKPQFSHTPIPSICDD